MENYKESIQNMLKTNNDIQPVEGNIKKFLEADLNNNKITMEEYIELIEFLSQKIKEKNENDRKKRQSNFRKELKEVYQKLYLDVRPIYKGEMGVVAPKRKIEEKISDDQEEER